MRIQHNISALNSYRQLNTNNNALAKNLEKLSSGYRINRAGDDAAGLAISEKMRAQIKGLETAQKNANDGISLVQTAEGALTEVHSMLNRMVELATQSANGTYDDPVDRANLQKEVSSLLEEIDRIAESTNYNGIKLLDGSLSTNDAATITDSFISSTAGVTLGQGENGAGAQGEFTIDLSKGIFGTGDKITIGGTKLDGTSPIADVNFTYDNTDETGVKFTGDTSEEQAASLAEAIKRNADFNQAFDVKVDGSEVVLTSREEGAKKSTITKAIATDANAGITTDLKAQPPTANTKVEGAGWNAVFGTGSNGSGNGSNVALGDIVEFNFKINNKTLTAKVEITQAMVDVGNSDIEALTNSVVEALKTTSFEDNPESGVDESLIKVGDLFDITANNKAGVAAGTVENGSINFSGKTGVFATAGDIVIKRDGEVLAASGTVSGVAGVTPGAIGDEQIVEVSPSVGAPNTPNFSKGDIFQISGILTDGRSFTASLEAGKDFEIGAAYTNSIDNIVKALTDADSTIQIDVGAGSTAAKVDANKIFGAVGVGTPAKNDFGIRNNAGVLEITNLYGGMQQKGVSGVITSVGLTTAGNASSTLTSQKGVDQGYATSAIDVTKDIEYGAAIKVGDKTYEIVADSRDVTSRNNAAVVIKNLDSATQADIAKAIADTIKAEGNGVDRSTVVDTDGKLDDTKIAAAKNAGAEYIVSSQGGQVSITTVDKGSDIEAPKLSAPYGDKTPIVNIEFDPAKLSEGDIIEIEGKSYEFVSDASKAKDGNIAVDLGTDDFSKLSSKEIATALADVLKGAKGTVNDKGVLTVQALEKNGVISKPVVKFEDDGLSLQVGDTSDDYQKVKVKVYAMDSDALGIGDIDISTQEGASAAIDKIKAAINTVSSTRGDLGAIQNRLEHTINNLGVTTENLTAAESRIRDTDMASEMMAYTKNNILVQAAQAMLAQANQVPQGVLQLLQ